MLSDPKAVNAEPLDSVGAATIVAGAATRRSSNPSVAPMVLGPELRIDGWIGLGLFRLRARARPDRGFALSPYFQPGLAMNKPQL
jgi:hypothetical protein